MCSPSVPNIQFFNLHPVLQPVTKPERDVLIGKCFVFSLFSCSWFWFNQPTFFPVSLLPVAVQPSSVSSQPLQALRFSPKFSLPNYWGMRREGPWCPKAGSVTDKQNSSAGWVEGLPNQVRTGVRSHGVEVLGTGAVGLFAFISGERDLQEGSLSHKKLLLLRTL